MKMRKILRVAIRRARKNLMIPLQYAASVAGRLYYASLARHYRISATTEYRLSRQHRANARYFREMAYSVSRRQLDQRAGA